MKIAVGSRNPVKVQAVKDVAAELFDDITVDGVDAPSGVSEMPTTRDEAIEGAENRARHCHENDEYDYTVGLEGYVTDTDAGMFLSGWCTVIDADSRTGHGGKDRLALPPTIAERIRDGEELGPVMDDVTHREDTKQDEGAFGILTNGRVTRRASFRGAIRCAFTPLLSSDMYEGEV